MGKVDIWNLVHTNAGQYTIGFALMGRDESNSCGSGTLARIGEIVGVLTCAHALRELKKYDAFGILCFPIREKHFQSWRIEIDKVDCEILENLPWTDQGRDLGFLRLPPSRFAELEAIGSAVNLDIQCKRAEEAEPLFYKKFDVVAGVINCWKGPTTIEGRKATTQFNGLLNVGLSTRLPDANGMDRLCFESVPEEGFDLPETFKGTSGGGVWRFYLDDSLKMIERRLIGVAFWEDPEDKFLVCHGPGSLYGDLLTKIKARWT